MNCAEYRALLKYSNRTAIPIWRVQINKGSVMFIEIVIIFYTAYYVSPSESRSEEVNLL